MTGIVEAVVAALVMYDLDEQSTVGELLHELRREAAMKVKKVHKWGCPLDGQCVCGLEGTDEPIIDYELSNEDARRLERE